MLELPDFSATESVKTVRLLDVADESLGTFGEGGNSLTAVLTIFAWMASCRDEYA